MDIRFLESLIAVVETGSIAAAARVQNLTPAAIGQRIRTLEAEFDHALLSRDGHKAQPTQACLDLLPRAKMLVRESENLKADLDPTGLRGALRLGAISTVLTDFMPDIVKLLSQKAPDAELTITPGPSALLYRMLIEQKLDAILVVKPTFQLPKQIRSTRICQQRLVLISSNKTCALTEETLNNNWLIAYDKNSWGGRIAWEWIEQQTLPFKVLCEMDSPELIAILVEQGLGIAVLPEWKGLTERHRGLTVVPIAGGPKYQREISFLIHLASPAQNLAKLAKSAINVDQGLSGGISPN